ncbi:MAG: hypothetical protein ABIJ61_08195 [bacterium]
MSQKLKARINAIFVQLNRYQRERKDFSAPALVRDLIGYFGDVDKVDLYGGAGQEFDEHLKLRVNSVTRTSDALVKVIADVMVLYFWYMRRPGTDCSQSLVAAKKLRGDTDDGAFFERDLAPIIFGPRLRSFGKTDYKLREVLLEKAAVVIASFTESDPIPVSATRIIKTDTWHKKMFHISALAQAGRLSDLPRVAPREELHQISIHNNFARYYLRIKNIYTPPNRLFITLRQTFGTFFSLVFAPLNLRLLMHVLRNRLPVYLVYLAIAGLFVYGALNLDRIWQKAFESYLTDHRQHIETTYPTVADQ